MLVDIVQSQNCERAIEKPNKRKIMPFMVSHTGKATSAGHWSRYSMPT
jgi:hypothetical protein